MLFRVQFEKLKFAFKANFDQSNAGLMPIAYKAGRSIAGDDSNEFSPEMFAKYVMLGNSALSIELVPYPDATEPSGYYYEMVTPEDMHKLVKESKGASK